MSPPTNTNELQLSLPLKIISAGLAGCTADLCTFPLDTVKVWLQVNGESTPATKPTKPSPNEPHNFVDRTKVVASGAHKKPDPSTLRKMAAMSSVSSQKHTGTGPFRSTAGTLPYKKVLLRSHVSSAQALKPNARVTLLGTMMSGVKRNGFFSLYGGLAAGLQRQVSFCAVRIGLYDSVKAFYQDLMPGNPEGKQIPQRILAGCTTAFIAVSLFQPTEVVKIRMQAQTNLPKSQHRYKTSFAAYRHIYKGGVGELWKGLGANATRLGVVNVCELVTYDIVKELILEYRILNDNPICHFTSAFISGFITTVVASPVDVVKTRYMNSPKGAYKGPIECAKNMMVKEGPKAFYKGFVPAYLRLGTWNIVMFVSYEQYKLLARRIQYGDA